MAYCALILAGGKGSRMGFQEKSLIDINGRPLISYIVDALEKVVDNVIISVRNRKQAKILGELLPGYRFTYDASENKGPISGIISGLEACDDEYCFISACDMPFLNENVVRMLFEKCRVFDAAIPRWDDGFLEPLHAVYRTVPMIRETQYAIERGEKIILAPLSGLNVNYVEIDDIKNIDPDLRTFINVNTPDELRSVMELITDVHR
jgi:molybdopterin-guanine dinucleotide biosynthesis protein A